MKTPDEETETKTKEVENGTKNFESKNNTTYITENREWNNRNDSTGKNGIRNRVKKLQISQINYQRKWQLSKSKLKKKIITNNNKVIKENGQRKEKVEKTKYSDSEQDREETRPITFEVLVKEQKFKPKRGEKKTT